MTEALSQDQIRKNDKQLKLFEMLDGDKYDINVKKRYSNSITIIDLMPRFYRGNGARKLLAESEGLFENKFDFRGETCLCTVTPAIYLNKNIKTGEVEKIAAFPSDAEELIEKIIIMIASMQGLEKRNIGGNTRHVVSFSLYQIKQALAKMNSQKSYKQIRQSLIIIRDSNTRVTRVDPTTNRRFEVTKDVWSDSAIEVEGHGRGKDRCYIAFSDFVVEEITNLNYRQVLFSRLTCYSSTFSRFMDLYLSNMWINARPNEKKPISLLKVMESFGKANKSEITLRRDMRLALNDLVERKVITHLPSVVKKPLSEDKNDWVYNIVPTQEFVEEMIRSNGKQKGLKILNEKLVNGEIKELPDYVSNVYTI